MRAAGGRRRQWVKQLVCGVCTSSPELYCGVCTSCPELYFSTVLCCRCCCCCYADMSLPLCPHEQLSIKEGEISTGLGTQAKQFDIERRIKIVYLDDNLRIARCVCVCCWEEGRGGMGLGAGEGQGLQGLWCVWSSSVQTSGSSSSSSSTCGLPNQPCDKLTWQTALNSQPALQLSPSPLPWCDTHTHTRTHALVTMTCSLSHACICCLSLYLTCYHAGSCQVRSHLTVSRRRRGRGLRRRRSCLCSRGSQSRRWRRRKRLWRRRKRRSR